MMSREKPIEDQREMLEKLEQEIKTGYFNPMNDVLFKFIFGREEHTSIMRDFLNAVLQESLGHEIITLTFRPTEQIPVAAGEKLSRLDVVCTLDSGETVDVEVQVINYHNMTKRTLFYWAQLYQSQLPAGKMYQSLRPCITINIMQFNLFDCKNLHTTFGIYDIAAGIRLNRDLELHFIELPKYAKYLNKPIRDMSKMERWVSYFANKLSRQEKEELIMSDPAIADAFQAADLFFVDKDDRLNYINREMAILDYNSYRQEAHDDGFAEGHAEGRAEGRSEGLAEGRAEGRAEGLAEGLAEGQILELKSLVKDGLIPLELAAKRANMTKEAFAQAMSTAEH